MTERKENWPRIVLMLYMLKFYLQTRNLVQIGLFKDHIWGIENYFSQKMLPPALGFEPMTPKNQIQKNDLMWTWDVVGSNPTAGGKILTFLTSLSLMEFENAIQNLF